MRCCKRILGPIAQIDLLRDVFYDSDRILVTFFCGGERCNIV